MQNKANSVWSRAGDRRAGHAAPDLWIVRVLWESQVIRAGERVTVRSAAGFSADCPNSMSSGQAVATRRWDQTTQGTLRPPAFARNKKLGGRFRLRGLLTRPASVTAGVVARKVWNTYFYPPNARTVPVRRWSCTNTVESTVRSWEPVGYFALSPCGRG